MATLVPPSTVGSSLLAFLEAYRRTGEEQRAEAALARQNALAELQARQAHLGIDASTRVAGREADLSATLAALPGIVQAGQTPPSIQPIPGAPPMAETYGDPGTAIEQQPAARYDPGTSDVPISQVLAALTPEQRAAILQSETGGRAMDRLGVVPDSVF